MTTANFNIKPEDGWVAITSAGVDFIKVRQYPRTQPFYVTTGSSTPDSDGVEASGIITFTGQPSDADTITIGTRTYTFVTNFDSPGADEVLIGATQAATEAALTAAINGRAEIPATAATGSVIFAGLPVPDETVTIGAEVYTFKAAATLPFEVTIGADATETGDNLVTTITVDSTIVSGVNSIGTVTITADTAGFAGNSITLVGAATNTTVSGANLTGGNDIGPAVSLNSAVSAVDGVGTVTVTARTPGSAGNSVVFTVSASNVTVDGTGALAGGSDAPRGFLVDCEEFWVDVPVTTNFYVRSVNTTGPQDGLRIDVFYILTTGP